MIRRLLARVLLRVFPETFWELHRASLQPHTTMPLGDRPYAALLRAIADDLDQGIPPAALLFRADEILDCGVALQARAIERLQRPDRSAWAQPPG